MFSANRFLPAVIAGAGTALPLAASAAVDVSGVVTEIQATYAAAGPIQLIGAAVLLVVVAVAAFKWVRRAIG